MTPEPITTRTAKVWLREDGIVQGITLPKSYQTLEDARVNAAALARAAGVSIDPRHARARPRRSGRAGRGEPRPWLIDIRLAQGVDRQARVYYSSEAVARFTRAVALLIGSPVSRVIANFFIGLNKLLVPTRLFTSEDEAVVWLKNFIVLNV